MSFELDLDMPFAARMHTPTFARLPPGASHLPHSHLPPTHPGVKNATDVEASLPSLLRTIGPSLGLSPSPSPASVGEGRGFFSANTPFVLLYAVLLLCLAWRRLRGTSAPARQVWFVPFFALARVLFFALGWRVPHAQARAGLHGAAGRWQYGSGQGYGHKHVGGMGEQVATAAAEELGTFAGWVRGAALLGSLGGMVSPLSGVACVWADPFEPANRGRERGMLITCLLVWHPPDAAAPWLGRPQYYTAMRLFSDGMACYHPSNSIAFGLLKIWPTTAVVSAPASVGTLEIGLHADLPVSPPATTAHRGADHRAGPRRALPDDDGHREPRPLGGALGTHPVAGRRAPFLRGAHRATPGDPHCLGVRAM